MTDVVIIASGGANIASLEFALERLGCRPQLSSDPARIERANGRTIISFEEKHVPEFAAYLEDRLDELYRQFVNQTEEGHTDEKN